MWMQFLPYPYLAGLLLLAAVDIILYRQKASLSYLFFFTLFWLYLLLLISQILFPMPIGLEEKEGAGNASIAFFLSRINWIPFDYHHYQELNPYAVFLREVVANILLTMPFGFLLPFICRVEGKQIFWLSIAVGFGIELSQLIMCLILQNNYRTVDINDSMMNTIGVVLGYGCFRLFNRLKFTR